MAKVTKDQAEIEKLQQESAFLRTQAQALELATRRKALKLERELHESNILRASNVENRVYDFAVEVSGFSTEATIQVLSRWARLSNEPITLRFSSPGGSVFAGLGLYDAVLGLREKYKIKVRSVTLGMAASMAAILLQCGDVRVISPNAYFLVHEVSSNAIGKVSEMEDETKFAQKINNRLFDILAARAKVSRRTIATHAKRRDWWLDAEECLKFGFADEIGYV